MRWGWVRVGGMAVMLAGCARSVRPVLEPEGTVTRTWVGDEPPASAPAEVPPPVSAPPSPAASPPPPPAETVDPDDVQLPPGRVWKKAGAWGR